MTDDEEPQKVVQRHNDIKAEKLKTIEEVQLKNVVPLMKIPTKHEACTIARALAEKSQVRLTKHAREKMAERDVSFEQILNCLKKGVVIEGPYETRDGWKATFERVATEEPLKVECVLKFTQTALIVTVY